MSEAEQRALLGISLLAAFADGDKSDVERDRIRQITESFNNPALNAMGLYRDVLLHKVATADLVQDLVTPEVRQLAYEMALGVCEADNHLNDTERAFLGQLRQELDLGESTVAPLHAKADELTDSAMPPLLADGQAPSIPVAGSAEMDSMILNNAILAGALELLPGSLATMAIIPLQMRLVYRIGQHHGFALDRGHIGEFLAAAGLGVTSQVLEGYATKLMRGLLGTVAGGLGRGLGSLFTGSAVAFATTWAIGQLAERYYAGGRTLSGLQLQQTFQSLLGEARGLQQRYLPQIQDRSRTLDVSEVARLAGRS